MSLIFIEVSYAWRASSIEESRYNAGPLLRKDYLSKNYTVLRLNVGRLLRYGRVGIRTLRLDRSGHGA